MTISGAMRVSVPAHVLVQELGGEAVFLNLSAGRYFGLDETSTRLWQLLIATGSVRGAYDGMLAEYEVEPARLESDVLAFVAELARRRLLTVTPSK